MHQPWFRVLRRGTRLREQGWKLHVSCGEALLDATLEAVLPVLLAEADCFKVLGSRQHVRALNAGAAGATQVGKFLTIYPSDDEQAVRLARRLAESTAGLDAPPITTDRRVSPTSPVYYRYGGFGESFMQTRAGELVPAIREPSGTLVPDRREPGLPPPPWARDPFLDAGLGTSEQPGERVVAGRYFVAATLYRSEVMTVQLVLDTLLLRRAILKRPTDPWASDLSPVNAALEREGRLLRLLPRDGRFPELYDVVELGAARALILEDLGSETLEARVHARTESGEPASDEEVVSCGVELAAVVEELHARGYVYGDLKSTNVLCRPDGSFCLIDFGACVELGALPPAGPLGTLGYLSPERRRSERARVEDDVYSLGALLYFVATGAEPSIAPSPSLLTRALSLMWPAGDPGVHAVIERCLDPAPEKRPQSLNDVRRALGEAIRKGAGARPRREGGGNAGRRARFRSLALGTANALAAGAETPPSGGGLAWRSTYFVGEGVFARDVNSGTSGTMLALADLVLEFRDPIQTGVLREAARWLRTAPLLPGQPLPGLCVGEAGVAAALLRAGQVLEDAALVSDGITRVRALAASADDSPDVFHGLAGQIFAHLVAFDETGAEVDLANAERAGELLLELRECRGDECWWVIPAGYDRLSGEVYLGYAHGTAGIGDALLDLAETTGRDDFAAAALGALAWLARQAEPLSGGAGVAWPARPGGSPAPPFWCHGAAGIGRFFLHASRLALDPRAEDFARRAGHSTASCARWSGATQCHGLSGAIELLLDLAQATGDREPLEQAYELAEIMTAFAVEAPGGTAWISEGPRTVTPDYLVGYAGIAACLLRLASPERPRQLSREGFRYRVDSTSAATPTRSSTAAST